MSVAASRWAHQVLADDPTISRAASAVLVVLADDAHVETSDCYTARATIGRIVKYGRSSVWRAVRELSNRGLIRVVPRPGQTDRYVLPVPAKLSTARRAGATGRKVTTRRAGATDPSRGRDRPVAWARRIEGNEGCEGARAVACPPTPEYLEAVAHLRARRLGEA